MDKRYYSLAEAARRHFPDGRITARSLRTEIEKGRLRAIKIAGKLIVTDADIEAMIEAARRDAETALRPRSAVPGQAPAGHHNGLSETEWLKRAQAAALRTAREPVKRSSEATLLLSGKQ